MDGFIFNVYAQTLDVAIDRELASIMMKTMTVCATSGRSEEYYSMSSNGKCFALVGYRRETKLYADIDTLAFTFGGRSSAVAQAHICPDLQIGSQPQVLMLRLGSLTEHRVSLIPDPCVRIYGDHRISQAHYTDLPFRLAFPALPISGSDWVLDRPASTACAQSGYGAWRHLSVHPQANIHR